MIMKKIKILGFKQYLFRHSKIFYKNLDTENLLLPMILGHSPHYFALVGVNIVNLCLYT